MSQTKDAPLDRLRKSRLARSCQNAPAYVRIPLGTLFILGGFLWFLPVLGLWMFPVGLLLIAPEAPWARRLIRRMMRLSLKYRLIQIRRPRR